MCTPRRLLNSCTPKTAVGCSDVISSLSPPTSGDELSQRVLRVLHQQGAIGSLQVQKRFVDELRRSIRLRQAVTKRWATNRNDDDIIGLIQIARDAGDLDEAICRSFLAAHFGRASANESQYASAADFLCAFGKEPYWTWSRATASATALRDWLINYQNNLQALNYGNHRKYESKQPDDIWKVLRSFVDLATRNGGPARLVALEPGITEMSGFDVIYRRLRPIVRFGRTGRFDFLTLLIDLQLFAAEPSSCYLRGSTGPKKGARKLWGERSIGESDYLATDLAQQLGISPMALEDALCNWQK